ncbi:DUF4012 domain-containing protein [Nocardioides koreensis]|uniref:DUF4012 domain-containing protein n=1 Tax=Nocardioides koreensis TaxID=433651 RepID=A0ABP5KYR0_9ACTN
MPNRRRLLWIVPIVVVGAAVAYTAWLAWQVQGDLRGAESSVTRLKDSLDDKDPSSRDAAVAALRADARSAADRTDGVWWSALTHVPAVGDDAAGVQAMSSSLNTIANEGVQPLSDSVQDVDHVLVDGRIDVAAVRDLQQPVGQAQRAFAAAAGDVSGLDSSGYVGPLRSRFQRYASLVDDTAAALGSAEKATEVLPGVAGADGPRDYLLVFQNNAEIRATGGLPGSWARLHAENGRLQIVQQGTANEFPERATPILPLTKAELALHHEPLGTYFHDANFTPDFPRAAELWTARWQEKYPTQLDGVLSLDPVAMSYLLEGTGPVRVGDLTLTSDNAVEELLNRPYRDLGPAAQDVLFAKAARAIFEASTADLASPMRFVEGLDRAAREGRFLFAPRDPAERKALAGTRVEGALTADDGQTPHVDIALNDGTGSKMSYYLRYWADLKAIKCQAGQQTLTGSMTLNQNISVAEAAKLPPYLTGGGQFGVHPGKQIVLIPLFGPYGGTIDHISVNGKSLDDVAQIVDYRGRPATVVFAQLSSSKEVVFNWTMTTGKGQTGNPELGMTPSIVPGNNDATFKSAC